MNTVHWSSYRSGWPAELVSTNIYVWVMSTAGSAASLYRSQRFAVFSSCSRIALHVWMIIYRGFGSVSIAFNVLLCFQVALALLCTVLWLCSRTAFILLWSLLYTPQRHPSCPVSRPPIAYSTTPNATSFRTVARFPAASPLSLPSATLSRAIALTRPRSPPSHFRRLRHLLPRGRSSPGCVSCLCSSPIFFSILHNIHFTTSILHSPRNSPHEEANRQDNRRNSTRDAVSLAGLSRPGSGPGHLKSSRYLADPAYPPGHLPCRHTTMTTTTPSLARHHPPNHSEEPRRDVQDARDTDAWPQHATARGCQQLIKTPALRVDAFRLEE
ncbi:hypothetical protein B0H15DRAFT_829429 [Mycena belliarum]|uniref:Uncharacterized protein n=1 Tax=Mycena belliarum TaxID=1033014 RepID=A0AAD6XQA1_9AGAR|nr:hypothetical protein B0H15DRAFT_829429 [Mycena belliae]